MRNILIFLSSFLWDKHVQYEQVNRVVIDRHAGGKHVWETQNFSRPTKCQVTSSTSILTIWTLCSGHRFYEVFFKSFFMSHRVSVDYWHYDFVFLLFLSLADSAMHWNTHTVSVTVSHKLGVYLSKIKMTKMTLQNM